MSEETLAKRQIYIINLPGMTQDYLQDVIAEFDCFGPSLLFVPES
jgi:hypothetical protein